MAVAMKIVVDWYVKSCNLVDRPKVWECCLCLRIWRGGGLN